MKLQDPRPGKWRLFRIWASIGLQSFGGGASTTLLIQRAFIEKHRWLSMEEFTHLWSLCILTPGINLVALTVLIGRKLGGAWGIVVSLAGLLLPSATITCLITAGFAAVQHLPIVQAILRGVVPATAGIMLLVGLNFALPLIRRSYSAPTRLANAASASPLNQIANDASASSYRSGDLQGGTFAQARRKEKEGVLYLLASSVLIIACALAVIFLKLSVIVVVLGAAFLGALFFSPKSASPLLEEEQGEQP